MKHILFASFFLLLSQCRLFDPSNALEQRFNSTDEGWKVLSHDYIKLSDINKDYDLFIDNDQLTIASSQDLVINLYHYKDLWTQSNVSPLYLNGNDKILQSTYSQYKDTQFLAILAKTTSAATIMVFKKTATSWTRISSNPLAGIGSSVKQLQLTFHNTSIALSLIRNTTDSESVLLGITFNQNNKFNESLISPIMSVTPNTPHIISYVGNGFYAFPMNTPIEGRKMDSTIVTKKEFTHTYSRPENLTATLKDPQTMIITDQTSPSTFTVTQLDLKNVTVKLLASDVPGKKPLIRYNTEEQLYYILSSDDAGLTSVRATRDFQTFIPIGETFITTSLNNLKFELFKNKPLISFTDKNGYLNILHFQKNIDLSKAEEEISKKLSAKILYYDNSKYLPIGESITFSSHSTGAVFYEWTTPSAGITVVQPNESITEIIFDAPGLININLQVKDKYGNIAKDEIQVKVKGDRSPYKKIEITLKSDVMEALKASEQWRFKPAASYPAIVYRNSMNRYAIEYNVSESTFRTTYPQLPYQFDAPESTVSYFQLVIEDSFENRLRTKQKPITIEPGCSFASVSPSTPRDSILLKEIDYKLKDWNKFQSSAKKISIPISVAATCNIEEYPAWDLIHADRPKMLQLSIYVDGEFKSLLYKTTVNIPGFLSDIRNKFTISDLPYTPTKDELYFNLVIEGGSKGRMVSSLITLDGVSQLPSINVLYEALYEDTIIIMNLAPKINPTTDTEITWTYELLPPPAD